MRLKSDGARSYIEYDPDPRHAELFVKPLHHDSVSQDVGRGVPDVPAVGRIEDTSLSRCGDETRLVLLSEGVGQRHAVTDGKIHWKVSEDTSTTRSKFSSNGHPLGAFCDWTCVVTATMRCATKHATIQRAHCLKVSSHTKSTVSLSGGASEYHGIVKCAAGGLGTMSMLADFGMCAEIALRTDSSSGLGSGLAQRPGSLTARADSIFVGAAARAGGRLESPEGAK